MNPKIHKIKKISKGLVYNAFTLYKILSPSVFYLIGQVYKKNCDKKLLVIDDVLKLTGSTNFFKDAIPKA